MLFTSILLHVILYCHMIKILRLINKRAECCPSPITRLQSTYWWLIVTLKTHMPAVIPYRPPCSDSFEFFSENNPQIVFRCIPCCGLKTSTIQPLMSDLPADHVPGIRSFDGVGSIFVGPFLVRTSTLRNAKIVRAYLCVFVCLLTKVVNLVSSLSTPAFVPTLDRFISWRGLLSLIRSDCGNNYWGTSNYLKEEYTFLTANQN